MSRRVDKVVVNRVWVNRETGEVSTQYNQPDDVFDKAVVRFKRKDAVFSVVYNSVEMTNETYEGVVAQLRARARVSSC